MKEVKCIKCDISVSKIPYVPQCPIGGNHEFPNVSPMPEQDNWKEEFNRKFFTVDEEGFYIPLPTPELIGFQKRFIEDLLSSQAHALKEKMKQKAFNAVESRYLTYTAMESLDMDKIEIDIHNQTISEALSAIESIEI